MPRTAGEDRRAARAPALSLLACGLACCDPVGVAVDGPASTSMASNGGAGRGEADGAASADGAATRLCRGLDVLFVVDNSGFMAGKLETLAGAVPAFIDAAWVALPLGSELHVALTTTSFFAGSSSAQSVDCRPAFPERIPPHYIRPQDADTGENGGQGRLFEHQGKRYYSANTAGPDRENLEAWLASAVPAVGSRGSTYEMPSAAAGYAFHPANAEHNRGFLRDEGAVLAIFALSDGIDTSLEATDVYAASVRSAKARCGGDACVATGGLLSSCARDEGVSDPLYGFLHAFGGTPSLGEAADFRGAAQPAEYARVGQELALRIREACLSGRASRGAPTSSPDAGGARVEE